MGLRKLTDKPLDRPLDDFHWHEALDRTHVIADTFDGHILSHPAISRTPGLKREAEQISVRLHRLYQSIGHLSPQPTE